MQFIDFLLLLITGGFALFGLWFGFIHTLGSLVGTILGAYFASRWFEGPSVWIAGMTDWDDNLVRVIVFIVIFLTVNRFIGFGFWIVDRVLSIVTRLPFLSSLNHLLGLLLGVFEGMITLGLIIFFIERFPLSDAIMFELAGSALAPTLADLAAILWPVLPDALRLLQSSLDDFSIRATGFATSTLR